MAGAGGPEAGVAEADVAEAGTSEAGVFEAGVFEVGVPGAGDADVGVPEVGDAALAARDRNGMTLSGSFSSSGDASADSSRATCSSRCGSPFRRRCDRDLPGRWSFSSGSGSAVDRSAAGFADTGDADCGAGGSGSDGGWIRDRRGCDQVGGGWLGCWPTDSSPVSGPASSSSYGVRFGYGSSAGGLATAAGGGDGGGCAPDTGQPGPGVPPLDRPAGPGGPLDRPAGPGPAGWAGRAAGSGLVCQPSSGSLTGPKKPIRFGRVPGSVS
jgi:hypothetical protein